MNRSNECHLCNVAHYGDLNRKCDTGLKPSFALLFMSRLGSRPKIGYCITKCLRTQFIVQQVVAFSVLPQGALLQVVL